LPDCKIDKLSRDESRL